MPLTATDAPRRHRLTVGDYYRMAEVGIFRPEQRVELVEGAIIDVPPPGSRHAGTLKQLGRRFQRTVGDAAIVQVQDPIALGRYSEPQPDLALVRPRPDFYKTAHPQAEDVLLVIEVADTSLPYDRDVKVPLYARFAIPEVWLLDLEGRRLTRHSEPREGEYARVDEPALDVAIGVGLLPGVEIELRSVFE